MVSLPTGFPSHLFVHEDVDDGIVNCGGLGEVGGQGCESRLDGDVFVGGHHQRKGGVGQPADEESHDHRDHHPRHLPLRLLRRVRLLLLCCSLRGILKRERSLFNDFQQHFHPSGAPTAVPGDVSTINCQKSGHEALHPDGDVPCQHFESRKP